MAAGVEGDSLVAEGARGLTGDWSAPSLREGGRRERSMSVGSAVPDLGIVESGPKGESFGRNETIILI